MAAPTLVGIGTLILARTGLCVPLLLYRCWARTNASQRELIHVLPARLLHNAHSKCFCLPGVNLLPMLLLPRPSALAVPPCAHPDTQLDSVHRALSYRRLRTRAQPEDAEAGPSQDDGSKRGDGSSESFKGADDGSAADSPGGKASVCEISSSNLAHGATICLVGPGGELMGLTTGSGKEEMSLMPISTTAVEAGSAKRIQSYPSSSIFVVMKQVRQPWTCVFSVSCKTSGTGAAFNTTHCRSKTCPFPLWALQECGLNRARTQKHL